MIHSAFIDTKLKHEASSSSSNYWNKIDTRLKIRAFMAFLPI